MGWMSVVLVSSVGFKIDSGQFTSCPYRASSYLIGEGTSPKITGQVQDLPLQKDLDLGVPSDSEVVKKPTAVDYVIEGIGGIITGSVGMAGTFIGGSFIHLILLSLLSEGKIGGAYSMEAIYVSYGVGLPTGSTLGVTLTGKLRKQNGSFMKSLIGSYLGLLLLGAPSVVALTKMNCNSPPLWGIAILLPPTIGAVIGYNMK